MDGAYPYKMGNFVNSKYVYNKYIFAHFTTHRSKEFNDWSWRPMERNEFYGKLLSYILA